MARTPALLGAPAIDPDPIAHDANEDEDHPDKDDEVSGVFAERKADNGRLVQVRYEIVLDEVEEKAEGHRDQPEPSHDRKRRRRIERRERDGIDQQAHLRISIANVDYC
jgi:hypothetical protein